MLGENLRKLRIARDLTQQQMADLLKINRVTYTQYENNKREPDNETLWLLADFFKVTIDDLLGRKLLKDQIISAGHPDPEISKLLKDSGIAKLKLAKDVTLEELKTGIELVKTLRKQKTGD
jgi:transcriptional regulator with XRE-family HTH domain